MEKHKKRYECMNCPRKFNKPKNAEKHGLKTGHTLETFGPYGAYNKYKEVG